MPLLEELLRPLPGDNPSGKYLRYSVYKKIEEARRTDDSGPQGEWTRVQKTANFLEVERLAVEALTKQTKDLQIAGWLTEAWLNQRGIQGLTDGLNLLRLLMEQFWDTVYPEIDEGDLETRAAPLTWVGAKLNPALKLIPITRNGFTFLKYEESQRVGYEKDAVEKKRRESRDNAIEAGMLTGEAFDEAKDATPASFYERVAERLVAPNEALEALDRFSKDKFAEVAPNLAPLRLTLEAITDFAGMIVRQRAPQVQAVATTSGFAGDFIVDDDPEPPAVPPPPPPPSVSSVESSSREAVESAPAATAPLIEEPASRQQAISSVVLAAQFLRKDDPSDATPYLLLRAIRGAELRAHGKSLDSAQLEAPSTETRRRLKHLVAGTEWQTVLDETEAAMGQPCGAAWLDLRRYAVQAATALSYDAVAQALRSEVAALLLDYPGLPNIVLADDTPAANPETRAWANGLTKASQPSQEIGHLVLDASATDTAVHEADVYELALNAVRSGQPESAIQMLARQTAQETSGRGRFLRNIQLAQICHAAGHSSIAYPILHSLADEIASRNLEKWEAPELLARPLALLFRCLGELDGKAEEKQSTYAKICCLDPVQAMEVGQ